MYHITYNKYMIILHNITFNILDANFSSKMINTRGARSTLSNIMGSVLSL